MRLQRQNAQAPFAGKARPLSQPIQAPLETAFRLSNDGSELFGAAVTIRKKHWAWPRAGTSRGTSKGNSTREIGSPRWQQGHWTDRRQEGKGPDERPERWLQGKRQERKNQSQENQSEKQRQNGQQSAQVSHVVQDREKGQFRPEVCDCLIDLLAT
jgi:hypothetical protein